MNRFVIVDGLPYLLADGKTYAVRWDAQGFTVGAEVKLASVPVWTHPERAILAKCAACLDSIGGSENGTLGEEALCDMTVAELKEFAEAHGIDLGEAKKKQDIINAIKNGGA